MSRDRGGVCVVTGMVVTLQPSSVTTTLYFESAGGDISLTRGNCSAEYWLDPYDKLWI